MTTNIKPTNINQMGFEAFRTVLMNRPSYPVEELPKGKLLPQVGEQGKAYRDAMSATNNVIRSLKQIRTPEAMDLLVLVLSDLRHGWYPFEGKTELVAHHAVVALEGFGAAAIPHLIATL